MSQPATTFVIDSAAKDEIHFGLFFELDYVAAAGRRAAFEMLTQRLGERELEWSVQQHQRLALAPDPVFYIDDILAELDARRFSSEKLLTELRTDFSQMISDGKLEARKACIELLKAISDAHTAKVAISAMSQQDARELHQKLGLDALEVGLLCVEPRERNFPQTDHWLAPATALSLAPRSCTAIAAGAQSCRNALAAGMPCIAMPDDFTAFEDFSGAIAVIEPGEQMQPAELLKQLTPVTGVS